MATLLAGAARVQAQAAPPPALATDDHWHFVIAPYFWASGISGNVSVGNLVSVPIAYDGPRVWFAYSW